MIEKRTGEVIQLGRLIDSDTASSLGDRMLKGYADFVAKSRLFGDGTLNVAATSPHEGESALLHRSSNNVALSNQDFASYSSMMDKIRGGAAVCVESYEPSISGDFFIGSAAGGRWHIDGNFDYRVLVNLSRFPISLSFVAERPVDARMSDWETILDCGYKPDSYDTISYEPGEAIAINNFCHRQEQILHVGSGEKDKVFLRYLAENPFGSDFLRTTLS